MTIALSAYLWLSSVDIFRDDVVQADLQNIVLMNSVWMTRKNSWSVNPKPVVSPIPAANQSQSETSRFPIKFLRL
jgi:hypothetical protein